jgi:hypothetical protein
VEEVKPQRNHHKNQAKRKQRKNPISIIAIMWGIQEQIWRTWTLRTSTRFWNTKNCCVARI